LHDVVVPECRDITAVIGYVDTIDNDGPGRNLRNAAAVVQNGVITAVAHKRNLCRYRYYDETRYFSPGEKTIVAKVNIGGKQRRVGILICEDLWDEDYPDHERELDARYPEDLYERYTQEGFKALLRDTYRRYRSAAFKRSQSCPTVIVSPRALGFDLRETIINHWKPDW
jgi:predicted amidohydrolase